MELKNSSLTQSPTEYEKLAMDGRPNSNILVLNLI